MSHFERRSGPPGLIGLTKAARYQKWASELRSHAARSNDQTAKNLMQACADEFQSLAVILERIFTTRTSGETTDQPSVDKRPVGGLASQTEDHRRSKPVAADARLRGLADRRRSPGGNELGGGVL